MGALTPGAVGVMGRRGHFDLKIGKLLLEEVGFREGGRNTEAPTLERDLNGTDQVPFRDVKVIPRLFGDHAPTRDGNGNRVEPRFFEHLDHRLADASRIGNQCGLPAHGRKLKERYHMSYNRWIGGF